MQHEFLVEMLKACKENGIHTAIETTGFGKAEDLLSAAEHLDLVFFDVKHMNDERLPFAPAFATSASCAIRSSLGVFTSDSS